MCLNILREDWKPVLTINSIVYGLQYLFLVSIIQYHFNPDFIAIFQGAKSRGSTQQGSSTGVTEQPEDVREQRSEDNEGREFKRNLLRTVPLQVEVAQQAIMYHLWESEKIPHELHCDLLF